MSTPALTVYISREWDGETPHEVGHFWRKFDGQPTAHGCHLKRVAGASQFETLWELVGAVSRLTVKARGLNYNWMFVPVDPHAMEDVNAEFTYYLSLVDEDGEMPRGGACRGKCYVHLVVKQYDSVLYEGLLKDYTPEDPA